MKSLALFIIAYLILTGVALLAANLLKMTVGEGMMIASSFLIADMYLFGRVLHFNIGIIVMCILGVAGYLSEFVLKQAMPGKLRKLRAPYWVLLSGLFMGSLVIYYHDFIWHIDEFHQWAAAVKYMLDYDRLPIKAYNDFIGGYSQLFGTSLFHYFFQKIGGYSEGGMYATAALLSWIGFLLPFSSYRNNIWKNWRKTTVYVALLYVSIYTLYTYGTKNLYVDLPAAAWSGGLAVWWITGEREKKAKHYLTAGCVLICTYFFKSHVGLLLDVLTILLLLGWKIFNKDQGSEANVQQKKKTIYSVKTVAVIICLLFAAAALIFIWDAGGKNGFSSYVLGMANSLRSKIRGTTISFVTCLFGTSLSTRSSVKITFIPALLLIMIITGLTGHLENGNNTKTVRFFLLFEAVSSALYLGAVYAAYLFIFSAEEASKSAGISRYFSIIILYLLTIALVRLVLSEGTESMENTVKRYVLLGLLFFFCLGLNKDYIPNHTSLNKAAAAGYEDIKRARDQISEIRKIITDKDKVYILYQDNSNEFPTNAALYYLDQQSSNYLEEPWKFTEKGSIIRLRESDQFTIEDFPQLLSDNGYTYVWIYNTDEYLEKQLPKVLECDYVTGPALYKVLFDSDEGAVGLELVKQM